MSYLWKALNLDFFLNSEIYFLELFDLRRYTGKGKAVDNKMSIFLFLPIINVNIWNLR